MDYSKYTRLEFRRKFWKLVGAEINIINPEDEQQVGYIKMKAWRLREDVRLFTDQSMQQEVVHIQARNIIDFGATYDVYDSANNQLLFSLRRKGLKSTFVRDHWDILDASGTVTGTVQETSGALALMRRWLSLLLGDIIDIIFSFVLQTYEIRQGSQLAATIVHRKNPVVVKMSLDTTGAEVKTDPRMNIAATAMLSIIDAAKNN